MADAADMSGFDEALRGRLALLIEQHSQAEIARRTGTSKSNVNRYMSGTKVPAGFCADLARGLNVNPAWLLTGEGMPFASDVSQTTAGTAAELLQLVEAMKALAELHLDALASDGSAHAPQQLKDALDEYQRLGRLLNERTHPVLLSVLRDLHTTIRRHDEESIGVLHGTARLVGRLCDDDYLHIFLGSCEARIILERDGDIARAIGRQRTIMLDTLTSQGERRWIRTPGPANDCVYMLRTYGRHEEAGRIAWGLCRVAGDHGLEWAYTNLKLHAAMSDFELGGGHAAFGRILRLRLDPSVGPVLDAVHGALIFTQVVLGMLSPRGALALLGGDCPDVSAILEFALWVEEADYPAPVLAAYAREVRRLPESHAKWRPRVLIMLLELLKDTLHGDTKAALAHPVLTPGGAHAPRDPYTDFLGAVTFAQRARLAAERDLALKSTREADRVYLCHRNDVQQDLIVRAIHYRNALELIPATSGGDAAKEDCSGQPAAPGDASQDAALRIRAISFFEDYLARGYLLFQDVAARHGLEGGGAPAPMSGAKRRRARKGAHA